MARENLTKYINLKVNQLLESDFTFKTLFDLIHDQDDRLFCEYYSSFIMHKITYKDFKNYVYKFASYLNDFISLPKGNVVGLYMDNSLNWVAVFWSILMLGYKPLLINTRLPDTLNREIVKLANCELFISEDDNIDLGIQKVVINKSLSKLSEVEKCSPLTSFNWENEIILSTTATTLNVKLCFYNGSNIIYQILNTKGIVKKNPMIKETYNGELKMLMFLPLYHVFGLIASYFWFSFFGRIFVFLKDYSPATIVSTIRKHKVTHVFAVPLLWNSLVKEIQKEVDKQDEKTKKKYEKGLKLSYKLQKAFPNLGLKVARKMFKQIQEKTLGDSVKFMISGGSHLRENTLETLNLLGYPLHVGYGASEIGITSVELRNNIKYRITNSIGKPFDNVTYVVDENILKVKSLSMADKIVSKDKYLEVGEDDFFITNDIVEVDKNGNYFILGRQDDVFIGANGEKINPDVIEKDLYFKNIERFALLDIPKNNKPSLCVVIEIQKGTNAIILNKIIEEVEYLKTIIKDNNYPIENIYYTYNPIINPNAIKVSRKALRRMIDNGSVVIEDISKLQVIEDKEEINNEITLQLKSIFAKVLNINEDQIKNDSNFILDLGGSSLDYFTLVVEIEKAFNIKVDVSNGLRLTVSSFAELILQSTQED